MPERQFPVRPNLDQLRRQARELLRQIHDGDVDAVAALMRHRPAASARERVTLADAQHTLARGYGLPNWPRLVYACQLTDAIWRDDPDTVRALILREPRLLHESARGMRDNWGPPLSYAANIGRGRIIELLLALGAADLDHAFDRACLQGQIQTARELLARGANPQPGTAMGPCETLCPSGLALLIELGVKIEDERGDPLAPVGLVLETYARNPAGKHGCLEVLAQHGVALPDTPTMAIHRGRLDLLAAHVQRDPDVVHRRFSHEEIFPQALGCHADPSLALHGTPLAGGTLLHLCVDFDELELARWLLDHGADVNARAAIDADGFGGHTALYGCVVSQTYRAGRRRDDQFARLLLDAGADVTVLASLRKRLRFVEDESEHRYHDVTPLAWGEQFRERAWVNPSVMQLLREYSA